MRLHVNKSIVSPSERILLWFQIHLFNLEPFIGAIYTICDELHGTSVENTESTNIQTLLLVRETHGMCDERKRQWPWDWEEGQCSDDDSRGKET